MAPYLHSPLRLQNEVALETQAEYYNILTGILTALGNYTYHMLEH